MSSQYGFYMDLSRCTGCKTCQLACKDYKDLPPERNFRRVYEYTGGNWQADGKVWHNNVFSYYISVSCNHCKEPACLEVCPTEAIFKNDEGLVLIDESKCIGCQSCAAACPYGAPQFDEEREVMTRCDACKDRVKAGSKPICVESCPLRALDFGLIEDLQAKYGTLAEVAPLPVYEETKPSIVIKPNTKSRPAGDTMGAVANPLEV